MNVKLVSTHVGGAAHRTWLAAATTSDAWSFLIAPGQPVQEADGRLWSSAYPVVAWFSPAAFFQVFVLLKETGVEYYCNIISPPRYDGHAREVVFCDLDLDVRVDAAGVRAVDEDEFALRRGGYPPSWVAAANAAKDRLCEWAGARRGPFSVAAARRWARLASPCLGEGQSPV